MIKKTKGFLLLESMTALFVSILGLSLFVLTIAESQKTVKRMEKRTDYELAQHMMRENHLAKIIIHDQTCYYEK